MTRRLKIVFSILIAVSLLLAIALAGRFFWRETPQGAMDITRLPPAACDLNQSPCRVELPGGGELTVELAPRPLLPLQPLTARLIAWDIPAKSAQLALSGLDMDMPFDPVPLRETAPGQFIGKAVLPICVTGPMRWRAEFSVTGPDRQLIAEFRFDSQ